MGQLLTTEQVADLLQMSPHTVKVYRHRGDGPAFVRLGKQARYRLEDVEAWLERRVAETNAVQQ